MTESGPASRNLEDSESSERGCWYVLTELSIAVVIGLAFVVGLAVFVIGVVVIQR